MQAKEQQLQEELYSFPYHHLIDFKTGRFKQSKNMRWGYEYRSYIEFVIRYLRENEFLNLLDVGCGDGKFLYELKNIKPEIECIGIDYSKQAINFAQAFNPQIKFICGNIVDNVLINKTFDIITLIETLEHIPIEQIDNFLIKIHGLLKQNGTLLITVPSINVPKNAKHYQHFTINSLKSAVKNFNLIEFKHLNGIDYKVKILERLLDNRLFILNNETFSSKIYNYYYRKYLISNNSQCKRIFAVFKKFNN